MNLFGRPLSNSTRFFVGILLIQTVLLGLLAANNRRLIDHALETQLERRVDDMGRLLSSALAVPLAQRDLASVQDIVQEIGGAGDLAYLYVRDRTGEVVSQFGKRDPQILTVDGKASIRLAGLQYGEMEYGLSSAGVAAVRHLLMFQSAGIALGVILASWLFLFFGGRWLARQFATLVEASERIAGGNYAARLPMRGEPELDRLASAFNSMAESIQDNMQRVRENERRFAAIADYTYDVEFWLSPEGRLLWVNPSVLRLFGYTVEECTAMTDFPLELAHADEHDALKTQLHDALKGVYGNGHVFRARCKDGEYFWAIVNWLPIYNDQSEYQGLRASIHNIDALKKTEDRLRQTVLDLRLAESLQVRYLEDSEQERARLVALLSAMNLGILFIGTDRRVVYHNPAFTRMWAIDESHALIGLPVEAVMAKSSSRLAKPDNFSKHLSTAIGSHDASDSFEIEMIDGRVITELDYPVRDKDGRLIGHLWVYEDVTHERQTAEQLIYLAERDPLTGLFNRHRFQNELTRVINESNRHQTRCAVMFFDLDEFKEINDNFGHRAGDALLMRVASEVGRLIRSTETYARLGGDEFAILLSNVDEGEAEALAERVVRAVARIPMRFEGRNLRVAASLGIAFYPTQSSNAEDLVAKADSAMYQAKQAGKNTWRVFKENSQTERLTMERLTWNDRIGRALDHNLLRLYFQGVYHADNRALSHYEVLVRMIDERESLNMIMPTAFIGVAERSGRIIEIDRWVVGEAIRTLGSQPGIPALAVNISARSLAEPGLPQFIGEQLQKYHIPPKRLMVELTETAAVSDMHDAQRLIEALRMLGCGVCLDDFGTGFSSFAYLKHLHADTIKIDGMFIRDLHLDSDNQVFVKAIVDIAQGMGKTVVAEYVENEKVLKMLVNLGVDMVQGYLLDMPKPFPQLPAQTEAR